MYGQQNIHTYIDISLTLIMCTIVQMWINCSFWLSFVIYVPFNWQFLLLYFQFFFYAFVCIWIFLTLHSLWHLCSTHIFCFLHSVLYSFVFFDEIDCLSALHCLFIVVMNIFIFTNIFAVSSSFCLMPAVFTYTHTHRSEALCITFRCFFFFLKADCEKWQKKMCSQTAKSVSSTSSQYNLACCFLCLLIVK